MPDKKNVVNSLGLQGNTNYDSAKHYDQNRFSSIRMQRLDQQEKQFAHFVFNLVGTGASILDVPCGNGRFYDIFSQAKELTMADYSENMLKACKEKYNPGDHVRLIQSDIAALPLPDGSVDLAFCMRLFHHMKTDAIRSAALNELARVSRKYVALTFYNSHSLRYLRKRFLGKKISGVYISFNPLNDIAKKAGLECVYRTPKMNFIEQQCMVIFKKK
jgi:ubiquinone/menaquinone biosynthesis C-methylase UbiE